MRSHALLTTLLLVAVQGITQTAAAQVRAPAMSLDAPVRRGFARSENRWPASASTSAVSEGGKSHWLAGAAVGFVAGGGATALILHSGGSTAPCNRSANQDAMSSSECLGLTALGGVVGAAVGAFVGSRIRSNSDQNRRQLRIVPARRGGVQVGLLVFSGLPAQR